MSAITAGTYQAWIATLTGLDLETALKAGLDRPPEDSSGIHHSHSGCEIREMDGLALFLKNGSPHPLQHESVRDHTLEEVEDYQETTPDEFMPELAAALRRIVEFLIGGMSPEEIFSRSKTISQRVFVLCRALQLGDCEKPTLADIARSADLSRASLSKTSVQLRDAMGNHHLHFGGREEARATMREATTAAWKRRKVTKPE
jgi:hypothetical protein